MGEWQTVKVGEVFDVQLGKMLSKKAKEGKQFPYLSNFNVQWGQFDLGKFNEMHFNDREKKKYTLKRNDILMCEGGEVGRCAIWQEKKSKYFYQKSLHRLRVLKVKKVNPYYFCAYMRHICDGKTIIKLVGQTSIAHLTREKLLDLRFPCPPYDEQKAIADTLQTWDAAIEKTEALIAAKEHQFRWLSRKLIVDNEKLKAARGNWVEFKLGDIGTIITGNTPSKRDQNNYGGIYCWATAEDFCNRYILDTKIKLTEKGKKLARFIPPGSVLVTCIGSIGLNAIAKTELATNQQINSIIPYPQHDSDFIYYLLQNGKNKLKASAGTGGVLILNKSEFSKIKFLFPPLEEQKRIAEILNTARREIDLLKKLAEQYRIQKRGLMQKLLSGEWQVRHSCASRNPEKGAGDE